MKKIVYLRNLSLDEISERLDRGEKIYNDDENLKIHYEKHNGFLVRYKDDKITNIGDSLSIKMNYHFEDEVEESEVYKNYLGKLCKFWGDDEIIYEVGILAEIKNGMFRPKIGTRWYDRCLPLTEEEALELVKE